MRSGNDQKLDRRWWRMKGDDAGRVAFDVGLELANRADRRDFLRDMGRMYNNDLGEFLTLGSYVRDRPSTHNVTQNGVDAVHARITKSEPRPWLVTQDGDWTLYRRSEKMTLWLDGEFERLKVYELGPDSFHDSEVFGEGWVKIYPDEDYRPALELVWVGDLHVPEREERTRKVRTLYQTHLIDKEVLIEQYPSKKKQIDDSGASGLDESYLDEVDMSISDVTLCIEAWRLMPGGKVRHVVTVENATLFDEEYEDDWFPFARLPCHRNPRRFWHQGFVERMSGVQQELDKISDMITDATNRWAPSIWMEAGSVPSKVEVTNEAWAIYTYSGQSPPTFINPMAVAPDVSAREDSLKQSVLQDVGISELAAQSQKPAGLNSGKALTVHQDIESERFFHLGRKYERFFVDLAKRLIRCAERIIDSDAEMEDKLETMGGEEGLRAIKFKDARISAEEYRLRIFPTSALSHSPAGRLQNVANMMELGLITDQDDALELLQMPDIDRYSNERMAARHVVDKKIERTIDGPNVDLPHEHCDLAYAVRWGTLRRDLAEIKGAPDEVLDRLDAWVAYATKLQQEAAAAAQAAAAPPAAPPTGPMPGPDPMAMGQPPGGPAMPPMIQ